MQAEVEQYLADTGELLPATGFTAGDDVFFFRRPGLQKGWLRSVDEVMHTAGFMLLTNVLFRKVTGVQPLLRARAEAKKMNIRTRKPTEVYNEEYTSELVYADEINLVVVQRNFFDGLEKLRAMD